LSQDRGFYPKQSWQRLPSRFAVLWV